MSSHSDRSSLPSQKVATSQMGRTTVSANTAHGQCSRPARQPKPGWYDGGVCELQVSSVMSSSLWHEPYCALKEGEEAHCEVRVLLHPLLLASPVTPPLPSLLLPAFFPPSFPPSLQLSLVCLHSTSEGGLTRV